ncbi:MAG: PQQ-dependent sugar dehydrogenase [Ornithinimicrobium sp.]
MAIPHQRTRSQQLWLVGVAALTTVVTGCSAGTSGDQGGSDSQNGSGDQASGVQTLAEGFDVPWGLVVLDDGDALVSERDSAQVYRQQPGGDRDLVTTVPGVEPGGEGGLLGLAVPPGADGSTFLAYITTEQDNRVVEVDTSGVEPEQEPAIRVVLDGIPKAGNHNGGRVAFGPDDYLYVTTGDASDGASAQDPGSLGGKILRVTTDGEPAPGNPDPDSPIWSLGHRNVQGMDWDSAGRMWVSEFGQNDLDEVNQIKPGQNYGWPECEGPCDQGDFTDPTLTWATSDASPSGLTVGPDGDIDVAALRGESLWHVPMGQDGELGEPQRLLEGEFGRLRSVVNSPDDQLWVLTNNTSRGSPDEGDDRLLEVQVPTS